MARPGETPALEGQFEAAALNRMVELLVKLVLGAAGREEVLDRQELRFPGSGLRNSRWSSSQEGCGGDSLPKNGRACRSLGRKRWKHKESCCTEDEGRARARKDHVNPILGEALQIVG